MPNRFEVISQPNKFRLKPGVWVEPETTTTDDGIIQYVIYYDGITLWRKGVRDGCFVWDRAITLTGFDGVEDTDWENVRMLCGVGTTTTESPGLGFGLLYNWYAANDSRGLAPIGWHIPTRTEWQTLITYLGGDSVAGEAMKETGLTHWDSPNIATNTSGFTAFGAGWRQGGSFCFLREFSLWWFSTEYDSSKAWNYEIDNLFSYGVEYYYPKYNGYSIRCIRDSSAGWVEGEIVTDYDGKKYRTVQIGTQIWLTQNLAVTHYRNGDSIPEVTNNITWMSLTTGALCAYNNDWSNV